MEGGREHSSVADLSTGTSIAGYRIEAVLGHGSMGTVYSALEVSLERRVALKVLTPELSRRNPNYGGNRPRHLDAIVFSLGNSADEAAQAVERGDADFLISDFPPAGVLAPDGPLARMYGPGRYVRSPTTTTRNILMNYTHGPLRDSSLRRAVSLALDRGDLATASHGVPQATMIPNGVPGRVLARPAPAAPARARTLVGGRSVTLHMIIRPEFPEAARVAELVRRDLARIGITVVIRADPEAWSLAGDPKQGIDLFPQGWAMDYPDPANAVSEMLTGTDEEIWHNKRPGLRGCARPRRHAASPVPDARRSSVPSTGGSRRSTPRSPSPPHSSACRSSSPSASAAGATSRSGTGCRTSLRSASAARADPGRWLP
jgi:Bacterial extracellular solute-binding proteins, family 5 Middle